MQEIQFSNYGFFRADLCRYLKNSLRDFNFFNIVRDAGVGEEQIIPTTSLPFPTTGTGEVIFIPLSLLDQILSADFFFINFQTFLEVKIEINQLFWHPAQLIEYYKSCPLEALKMSIFFPFQRHARQGKKHRSKSILPKQICLVISWPLSQKTKLYQNPEIP